eukprot:GHVU01091836.1.p2 GENE.GHVU01091836.1~~GHVU01091836.1.p2  ORF type:complete len:142 (+),score=7.96 GHVU01091836.1:335-760(+)
MHALTICVCLPSSPGQPLPRPALYLGGVSSSTEFPPLCESEGRSGRGSTRTSPLHCGSAADRRLSRCRAEPPRGAPLRLRHPRPRCQPSGEAAPLLAPCLPPDIIVLDSPPPAPPDLAAPAPPENCSYGVFIPYYIYIASS